MEDSPPPENTSPVLGVVSEARSRFSLNKLVFVGLGLLVFVTGIVFYFLVIRKPGVVEQGPPGRKVSVPLSPESGSYYTGSQAIVLADLMGADLSGTGYRSVMPGHIFWAAHITAPDPPEGKLYQMWIVSNEIQYQPAGVLYKDSSGFYSNVYGFTFDTSAPFFSTLEELPNHITISLEAVEDTTMEQKLMEGAFTK